MIISRTPFRISFAGGGSDLPSFYRRAKGAVLSTSIDKYVYIAIHPFFQKNMIQLKYSKTECVGEISSIEHPIFRETLRMYNMTGVDINSIADIPSGTGMGSSSSFTVGLLNAVRAYNGIASSSETLSQLACNIEIEKIGSPIGKQDQYAAAYGGLNFITFNEDDSVVVEKVIVDPERRKNIENNLMLIYIGGNHSANDILFKQQKGYSTEDKFLNQKRMVELAYELRDILEGTCDINDFGRVLHEGWVLKRSLTSDISNSYIDDVYEKGLEFGALGGKLLGAGGAGFLLFYCPEDKQKLFKEKMIDFRAIDFHFDYSGSKIIYIGD